MQAHTDKMHRKKTPKKNLPPQKKLNKMQIHFLQLRIEFQMKLINVHIMHYLEEI